MLFVCLIFSFSFSRAVSGLSLVFSSSFWAILNVSTIYLFFSCWKSVVSYGSSQYFAFFPKNFQSGFLQSTDCIAFFRSLHPTTLNHVLCTLYHEYMCVVQSSSSHQCQNCYWLKQLQKKNRSKRYSRILCVRFNLDFAILDVCLLFFVSIKAKYRIPKITLGEKMTSSGRKNNRNWGELIRRKITTS